MDGLISISLEPLITEAQQLILRHFGSDINFTNLYQQIGTIMRNAVALQFEQGGRYFPMPENSGGWKPLAASTVKQRIAWGFTNPQQNILRRGVDVMSKKTGKLVYSSEQMFQSITYRASSDKLTIGTNVSYAKYHQLGQRPFLPRAFEELNTNDIEDIKDAIERFFLKIS
jgi:phage gpG-like protein